ncbi:MAG: response regulator [Acidimicrobiales bacterium]
MSGGILRLLVVDDDEVDRQLIRRSLDRAGIGGPVTMAEDGREALDVLRGHAGQPPLERPFMILLDLNMPRMSGIEFLEELRADESLRGSPVFVLSTSRAEQDITAAYEHMVAGYIVKETAGRDHRRLAALLDAYRRVVELPA